MSRPFPRNDPMLQGVFAPVFVEGNSSDLPVTGEIPKALDGTLYRNGPNPQFAPRGHYHFFGGDGMVHAFTLENGRATYRNRWVRTPRFELERKAGTALFGGFGDPSKSDPGVLGKDFGVANTHIVYHAGKLLALEESHLPFELTRSLNSIGYHTFGGVLPTTIEGRFTAHPKIDPGNGELVGFSYSGSGIFGTRMSFVIVAETASCPPGLFRSALLLLRPRLPHDERSRRLPDPSSGGRHEPRQTRRSGLCLGPKQTCAPRRGRAARSHRFHEVASIPPCYVFHTFNAWMNGGSIHCDVIKYDRAPLFPDVEGIRAAQSTLGVPVRWSIDLTGKTDDVRESQLSDLPGEFPRLDERHAGSEYHRAFYSAFGPGASPTQALFKAVAQLNLASGRTASLLCAGWRRAKRTRLRTTLGSIARRRRLCA